LLHSKSGIASSEKKTKTKKIQNHDEKNPRNLNNNIKFNSIRKTNPLNNNAIYRFRENSILNNNGPLNISLH
jgi:hypothetical protein